MKFLLLKLISLYQRFLSPIILPRCRYYPSCSNYCFLAISQFGMIRGGYLSLWRLGRCNPLFKSGVDLVPDSFSWFNKSKSFL